MGCKMMVKYEHSYEKLVDISENSMCDATQTSGGRRGDTFSHSVASRAVRWVNKAAAAAVAAAVRNTRSLLAPVTLLRGSAVPRDIYSLPSPYVAASGAGAGAGRGGGGGGSGRGARAGNRL